ncbi:Lrp/AsnC family transcriptional regulator [Kiloniella sp.]|uniref:Lrp/AsnC family transcriptional regulator n=1 Tax=Kiloniella sp. TaxID=1938587 RepID=UPI003A8EFFA7
MELDAIDIKILRILQTEGRIRSIELAERVGLSPTPCARRVKMLEDEGVITGYAARVDQTKLGYMINIFVSVELEKQASENLKKFEEEIDKFEEVVECYLMTGSQDFLLKVVATDLMAFEKFLQEKLTRIPTIRAVRSRFALRSIVERNALPSPQRAS